MSEICIKEEYNRFMDRLFPEYESAYEHGKKHFHEDQECEISGLINNHWKYRERMLRLHLICNFEVMITEGLYRTGFYRGWLDARDSVRANTETD